MAAQEICVFCLTINKSMHNCRNSAIYNDYWLILLIKVDVLDQQINK